MVRPKRDNSNLTRVQVDMPPKSLERLRRLQERTDATSYAEVMKNALRLYGAVVDAQLRANDHNGRVYILVESDKGMRISKELILHIGA